MINNYKKGDVVVLTYMTNSETFSGNGIVLDISNTILTIGHNFKGISPIDITKVPIKDIFEGKKVVPKEINSFDDFDI